MLTELGIGNSVYYPTQVHKLPSFDLELELKHTEDATMQVLSLPVHPSLSKKNLNRIVDAVNRVGESL
jgi:dTDP-4-amino-4,6-dideoxygalactose transaminase